MHLPIADHLLDVFRATTVALVARGDRDLSARQLAVFLICYLTKEQLTVRGLAAKLTISRSAITRALGRLEILDLVRRESDPSDRRSVLVGRTRNGERSLDDLKAIVVNAAKL